MHSRSLRVSSLLSLLACALAPACSPAAIGEAARPAPVTAAKAMGLPALRCSVGSAARPLIVDLPSTDRADLEAAMKHGTVVVSYDCDRLEVMSACHAPGEYHYAGVSRKEDLIRLDDQLEVRASLPISGARLSGELAQGTSLLLALVQVGKHSNMFDDVGRAELKGSCEGATHFVRAANLGAFSMETGASGRAAVVAELFGAGAGTSTSSTRNATRRDGSLEACRSAKPDAASPPGECMTPLRLELVPLASSVPTRVKAGAQTESATAPLQAACPPGMAFVDGKCAAASSGPHLCAPSDENDCKAQCDAGHAGSCYNLGLIWQAALNKPDKKRDATPRTWEQIVEDVRKEHERIRVPFEKACDGGEARSCDRLFFLYLSLKIDRSKALARLQQACDLGLAASCSALARDTRSSNGPPDVPRIRSLFDRGCKLGDWRACLDHVDTFLQPLGGGAPSADDVRIGVTMLERLCKNHVAGACLELSRMRRSGKIVARDDAAATSLLVDTCKLGWSDACLDAGTRYWSGNGAPKLPTRAEALFERACPEELPDRALDSCVPLARDFRAGARGLPKDAGRSLEYLTRSCRRGGMGACQDLAEMAVRGEGAPANPQRAIELYRLACDQDSPTACMAWAGLSQATDKEGAKAVYERYCRGSLVEACEGFKKLGGDPDAVRGKMR